MRKLTFLAGLAAGYVIGARAGRDSYDQVAEKAQRVWQDPRVQEKVGQAQDVVKDRAGDLAHGVAETVKDRLGDSDANGSGGSGGSGGGAHLADEPGLHPVEDLDAEPADTPSGRVTGYSGGGLS